MKADVERAVADKADAERAAAAADTQIADVERAAAAALRIRWLGSKLQPRLSQAQSSTHTIPAEYCPNAYFGQPSDWIFAPLDPQGGGHLVGQDEAGV